MPDDACVYFYDCKRCGSRLKPKPGRLLRLLLIRLNRLPAEAKGSGGQVIDPRRDSWRPSTGGSCAENCSLPKKRHGATTITRA